MKYIVSIISFVLISIVCFAQDYPTWMFNNQPSCAVGISLPAVQDSDFAEDISVLVANFAYGLSNKKYNQAKQLMNSKFIDGEYSYESALQIQIVHPQVDSIKNTNTLSNGSMVSLVKYKDAPPKDTIYCEVYEKFENEKYDYNIQIFGSNNRFIAIENHDNVFAYNLRSGNKVMQRDNYALQPKHIISNAANIYDGGVELIYRLIQSVQSTLKIKKELQPTAQYMVHVAEKGETGSELSVLENTLNEGNVALTINYFPINKVNYRLSIIPIMENDITISTEEMKKAEEDFRNAVQKALNESIK